MILVANSQTSPRVAGHADPARAVEDALTLLATGRAAMARTVLEPLPGLIREARAVAEVGDARLAAELRELRLWVQGRGREIEALLARSAGREREMEGREPPALRAARPRAPNPKPRPCQLLAAALASGRVTPERVAGLLRIGPAAVPAIAEGRVGLPASTWRRLLREIGEGRSP